MNVFIAGKGQVSLSNKEFIAQGGQGKIYHRSGIAYKIYDDPSSMIPVSKIKELSILDDPKIIKPQDVLLNVKNKAIGYTMQHVGGTYALCELFPKAFKDRKKLQNPTLIHLIDNMKETIEYVHSKNILIVDLNEMNFLVDDAFKLVYFIDVDNYQTSNFPCTAIMTNIRDFHAKEWNKLTDWFSFGIISFNLLIGTHPFKGRHPDFKFPMDENALIERMKKNVSVFDTKVQLPGVCQPLSVVPKNYLNWYRDMFIDGKRLPPPSTLFPVAAPTIQIQRIHGTDNFDITEIMELPEEIIHYANFGGSQVSLTSNGSVYIGTRRLCRLNTDVKIGITPKTRCVIIAGIESGRLKLYNASADTPIHCDIVADGVLSYGGRIYARKSGKVMEIDFIENTALTPAATNVGTVHEHASKIYDGVIIQPMFGKYFATIFPEAAETIDIRLDEVDGQIVDAKYDNHVLMIVASKNGKYNRYVIRFDTQWRYDVKTVKDVPFEGLNFVVLDNGVCCVITEAEEVELFRNVKNDPMVKVVPDQNIENSMRLFKNGTQVVFAQGSRLYSIKMK